MPKSYHIDRKWSPKTPTSPKRSRKHVANHASPTLDNKRRTPNKVRRYRAATSINPPHASLACTTRRVRSLSCIGVQSLNQIIQVSLKIGARGGSSLGPVFEHFQNPRKRLRRAPESSKLPIQNARFSGARGSRSVRRQILLGLAKIPPHKRAPKD